MLKKIILASLLAAPALASAQGAYFTAGGAFGSADLGHIEGAYFGAPHNTDDDVGRAVIGFGGEVSDYLGFQGSYMTKVENTVQGVGEKDTLQHSGFQAAAIGRAPLTPQLSLLGKLSTNLMLTEYDHWDGISVSSKDEADIYLGFGVGAQFRANDQVAVSVMAERIQMDDVADGRFLNGAPGDVDVDQIVIAANFFF